jgi:hypothetical protein
MEACQIRIKSLSAQSRATSTSLRRGIGNALVRSRRDTCGGLYPDLLQGHGDASSGLVQATASSPTGGKTVHTSTTAPILADDSERARPHARLKHGPPSASAVDLHSPSGASRFSHRRPAQPRSIRAEDFTTRVPACVQAPGSRDRVPDGDPVYGIIELLSGDTAPVRPSFCASAPMLGIADELDSTIAGDQGEGVSMLDPSNCVLETPGFATHDRPMRRMVGNDHG